MLLSIDNEPIECDLLRRELEHAGVDPSTLVSLPARPLPGSSRICGCTMHAGWELEGSEPISKYWPAFAQRSQVSQP